MHSRVCATRAERTKIPETGPRRLLLHFTKLGVKQGLIRKNDWSREESKNNSYFSFDQFSYLFWGLQVCPLLHFYTNKRGIEGFNIFQGIFLIRFFFRNVLFCIPVFNCILHICHTRNTIINAFRF